MDEQTIADSQSVASAMNRGGLPVAVNGIRSKKASQNTHVQMHMEPVLTYRFFLFYFYRVISISTHNDDDDGDDDDDDDDDGGGGGGGGDDDDGVRIRSMHAFTLMASIIPEAPRQTDD
jgi:hypothetical protein